MVRLRLALSLLTAAAVVGSCYSERLPPPNFRYACGANSDCNSKEECIGGLCQRPCTTATAASDCSVEDGFVTCINGVCVSTCELPDESCEGESDAETCTRPESRSSCTAPLTCLDLGIDIGGGGSNPFGGGGGSDLGVCGQSCSDDSCPDGELCLEGFCVQTCDPADPDSCEGSSDLTCQLGLCLPDLGDSGAGESMSASDTDPTATDSAGTTMGGT